MTFRQGEENTVLTNIRTEANKSRERERERERALGQDLGFQASTVAPKVLSHSLKCSRNNRLNQVASNINLNIN